MPAPDPSTTPRWAAAVLAAGLGTRMRSQRPKVLHELAGRPLVDWVLDRALEVAAAERVVVVVGRGADQVSARAAARSVRTALQEPQVGTGDALRVAVSSLATSPADAILVLSGDVPLLRAETVVAVTGALNGGVAAVLLSALLEDPAAYGRVVRGRNGSVRAVVEARDADPQTLATREVNAGLYAFQLPPLRRALERLRPDNAQGELYLTDVIALVRDQGLPVAAVLLEDSDEMHGVNSRADLAAVARILNRRVVDRLMKEGVTVLDPVTTWVEPTCAVAADTILEPGVHLRAGCRVGRGARIGAHSVLVGATVEPDEEVPPLTRRAP